MPGGLHVGQLPRQGLPGCLLKLEGLSDVPLHLICIRL
jgi:hypothetical protein